MAEKTKLTQAPPPATKAGLAPVHPATPPVSKGDTVTAPGTSAPDQHLTPVEAWIKEHPDFDNEPATVRVEATSQPVSAPTQELPAEPTAPAASEPTPPPTIPEPVEAPTVPTTQPQAVAPVSVVVKPTEKYQLAEGVEWTGEQIVAALKERAETLPLVTEARGYQKLFSMPLEQAQQAWGPILARLAAAPQMVSFLDGYLANPEKQQYLETCGRYFDEQNGAAPTPATAITPGAQAAPSGAPNDPLARDVAQLKSYVARQTQEAIATRVDREWNNAVASYPFLRQDRDAREALLALATQLNEQDVQRMAADAKARGETDIDLNVLRLQARGIPDALQMNRALYDARMIALQAAPATEPLAAAPAPALLGSPGAAPSGTRAPSGPPKAFNSTRDAVDDWMHSHPG